MALHAGEGGRFGAGAWLLETAPRSSMADRLFESERGRIALWTPVLFAAGIGAYFALPVEPPLVVALALVIVALAARLTVRVRALGLLVTGALLCMALGFSAAKLRTEMVRAPVLAEQLDYAVISGWAAAWEDRAGQKNRLTIRVRGIEGLPPEATPRTVRITTHADTAPALGAMVRVSAGLLPPPAPTHPGGFDFAQMAYFMGLGAVGYAKSDITMIDGPPAPLMIRLRAQVDDVRAAIGARVTEVLSGPSAGIATALISGDRGGISEAQKEAMRGAGLAHVLAISGMHMAIMAGAIYYALRLILVAVPGLALRVPVKKWAALAALGGALAYLLISGGSVATQRAFIMTAVFLMAVLLDRPALTLRNVLVAALLILALTPESLMQVSFQMSFAAATALIAVYERLRGVRLLPDVPGAVGGLSGMGLRAGRGLLRYAGGIGLTTMIAGVAVAPIGAFHFHTATSYSLLGNVLAMPLVGLCIMPAALVALLAMPFGLEATPLMVMGAGIDGLVRIAEWVSALPGAVRSVEAFPLVALVLITLGALWLTIWRGRWRVAGVAVGAIGLALTAVGSKPDILVDRDGKVIAVRTGQGALAAIPGRAGNYSLEKWLAADGDSRAPKQARDPQVFYCDDRGCVAELRGLRLSVPEHGAALAQDCKLADIVITRLTLNAPCPRPEVVVTRAELDAHGAHAIYIEEGGPQPRLRVRTAASYRGARPWTGAR